MNPVQLAVGRGHNDIVAGTLGGAAGVLRAAASSVADSAGHAGASAAGTDWGGAWEGQLAGSAEAVRRTGQNLAAAAQAYRETDEGQMRR